MYVCILVEYSCWTSNETFIVFCADVVSFLFCKPVRYKNKQIWHQGNRTLSHIFQKNINIKRSNFVLDYICVSIQAAQLLERGIVQLIFRIISTCSQTVNSILINIMKRKFLINNLENLMILFRMHDVDKPNRWVPLINRKLTGLFSSYAGKILILYLHFSESSEQHSQWRNYIAIWNTYIFVDSLPHSLDIYRMSRSTSQ